MEYFKGLLFLTTNRVGQIDDAFISRVHVAISYQPLTPDVRQKIWNGFFKKLVKERAGKIKVALNAKKWVLDNADSQDKLNGRDIRNALQTAIRLAEFEALEDPDHDSNESIVVEEAHFRRVLGMSNKFHKYVNSIRREDEKKRRRGRVSEETAMIISRKRRTISLRNGLSRVSFSSMALAEAYTQSALKSKTTLGRLP